MASLLRLATTTAGRGGRGRRGRQPGQLQDRLRALNRLSDTSLGHKSHDIGREIGARVADPGYQGLADDGPP